MKVLLVDDSRTMRNIWKKVITTINNSEAVEAGDGLEGLKAVKEQGPFHLMLVDWNMPNMDGLTMAEKIRGELKNASVNLIMLTTESSPSMKERGKSAGIKGWIVKPFNGSVVLETFKKLAA